MVSEIHIIPAKMVEHFQIIMFLLYTFVLPVDLIDPVMALVNVCPKNEYDVIQASKRLGCGNDIYGNNQYLCVPNKKKTSLVEFCFQGVMGIVEKGNCLEFSEGELIRHSCKKFSYGCPETHFYDYDIYKHPACQNISTELQCYVLDRNCTAHSNTEESSGQNDVIYTVSILGCLIVLIICCIIIIIRCYKRRRTYSNKSEYGDEKTIDETDTTLTGKKDENNANIEQEMPLLEKRDSGKIIDETVTSLSGNKDECKVIFEQEIPLSGIASKKNNEIRMVLLGKTGSGKSATGNTILGIKHFKSGVSVSSVSSVCAQKSAIRFGHKILIVDIPGIFDTSKSNKNIQKEIIKCISITSPGPHAFILVLNIGRFTEEEQKFVQHFVDAFGENIFRYCIVLFTRKDDLDEDGRNLDDHIKSVSPTLQTFIEKCGRRVIAFNNRLKGDESDEQVRELLSMISKNVEQNNGECYRIEMYEEAEKHLQEREAEIRKMAQMERDKEHQEIQNKIMEIHKRKIEFQKFGEEFMKRKEKQKPKVEQLRKNYYEKLEKAIGGVREENVEENPGFASTLRNGAKLVLPDFFKSYF